MCAAGVVSVEFLLPAAAEGGKSGESLVDEGDRSDLYEVAVLRIAADQGRVEGSGQGSEREAGSPVDAGNGHPGDRTWASYEPSAYGARDLPVSFARGGS